MSATDFDVLVLGGGSAGYAAARVAAGLGARVGLVERGPVGGLCMLDGCIPSKALIRSADVLHLTRTSGPLGVHATDVRVDFAQVMQRKRRLVDEFTLFRRDLIAGNSGVELLLGQARFIGKHEIAFRPTHEDGSENAGAAERHLSARKLILATGSYPWVPPIPELKDVGYITSDDALDLDTAPETMVILGGGLVAIETAQFYARMGTRVTILQRGDRILSRESAEIGEAIATFLREEGIEIHTNTTFHGCSRRPDGTRVMLAGVDGARRELPAEVLFVALGRRAAIHGLDLEAAGIRLDQEDFYVTIDDAMRTSNPDVYAAGDVAMQRQTTHLAVLQGEVAGANAAREVGFTGLARRIDYSLVPQVVFCDPPFARVGLNEQEAREQNVEYEVARYDFADHAMAELMGQAKGFVKMLAERDGGRILGVQLIGHQADTLIHEAVVAMSFHATAAQLARIPHFHPTLSEILPACAERLVSAAAANSQTMR